MFDLHLRLRRVSMTARPAAARGRILETAVSHWRFDAGPARHPDVLGMALRCRGVERLSLASFVYNGHAVHLYA